MGMIFFGTDTSVRERTFSRRSGFTLIELMVVIGIAAMLITMAATSFFGAMRQEGITKSRNQLRDTLLLARQQACILGKTHVVVCWNSNTEIVVGGKKSKVKQGRYALFQSVGNVWHKGKSLLAPFGIQREILGAALRENARVVNLSKPNDNSFMRIDYVDNHPTTENDKGSNNDDFEQFLNMDYTYFVLKDGKVIKETLKMALDNKDLEIGQDDIKRTNPGFWVATLEGSAPGDPAFPMAVRVTATFSLPNAYEFKDGDRVVFIFGPDGSLQTDSASSVTAAHSIPTNAKNATFTVSVDGQGTVSVK